VAGWVIPHAPLYLSRIERPADDGGGRGFESPQGTHSESRAGSQLQISGSGLPPGPISFSDIELRAEATLERALSLPPTFGMGVLWRVSRSET
jgi:hypothetical protein